MSAFRSRALTCPPRALLARRTNATSSDARKGKAPPPSGENHTHHHEESFGKGFYISIAAVVGCLALYKLEQSISGATGSPITRAIKYYGDMQHDWEERNKRHTAMIERAAADRILLQDSKPSATINLMFLEQFNAGSPYLNEVGWRSNSLTALQAHCWSIQREKEKGKGKGRESEIERESEK